MRTKKIKILVILLVVILTIVIIVFFIKNNYKSNNIGNNISNKTLDECEKYIYNISSYEATAEITVESNKNTNKYLIKQDVSGNECSQEVLEPENIKGVKFTYKNNQLTVSNTTLDLKKIYKDYPYIEDNSMFLTDFINQYEQKKKNGPTATKIEEEDNNVIFSIKNDNQYKSVEKLYLNKQNGTPSKLIVQDNNKKVAIYILYNEIKLNI